MTPPPPSPLDEPTPHADAETAARPPDPGVAWPAPAARAAPAGGLEALPGGGADGARLPEVVEAYVGVLDALPEAVLVVSADGRILAANRAVEEVCGRPRAEVAGRPVEVLLDRERTDPEELARRRELALAGAPQRFELWGRRADGRPVPVEAMLSTTRFLDRTVVVMCLHEVTARKATEEMLESEKAHFEQLFESSPEGLVLVDVDDRVLRVNPEFTRLFGYGELEALGRTLRELIVPEGQEDEALSITRRIAGGERLRLDAHRRRKDGTLVEVSVAGAAVQVHGHHVAVYGIYQDIAERKELERLLRRLVTTDALTGLLNRRGFLELAHREWVLASRRGSDVVLLFVDLDRFKEINDTHGHAEGDRLLQEMGELLRSAFRATDLVARLGGDEFVVLAVDAAQETELTLAERVRDAVRRFNDGADRPYRLGASVGAVRTPARGTPAMDDLLARADARMYAEKQRAR